ncbi:hypothetical protein QFC24_005756 [Naganishia onofrii]|uniref:Uncharacterized protein n=1 Tax=Naganishia onofrii TaxID=1851511 RepID=A0ACC2X6Q8_9TREE|nr:hypothetical protein QFC24_005756 [Naganishia onofrii]
MTTSNLPPPTSLPHALSTTSLSHIIAHSLRSAGFTTTTTTALHTLSSALELYLVHLATLAVSQAQDVAGRRTVGWDDVLGVLAGEGVGIGDASDVKRLVEREIAASASSGHVTTAAAAAILRTTGVGLGTGGAAVERVVVGRARRYRATGGKIPLEMNEDEAEEWFEVQEARRRAVVIGGGGGGGGGAAAAGVGGGMMLSRMSGIGGDSGNGLGGRNHVERGRIKGLEPLRQHLREGLPSHASRKERPVLRSVALPPVGKYRVERVPWMRELAGESEEDGDGEEEEEVKRETGSVRKSGKESKAMREAGSKMEVKGVKHESSSPSPSPSSPTSETSARGIKRRRSSSSTPTREHAPKYPLLDRWHVGKRGGESETVYDEPYLPPLPDELTMEPSSPEKMETDQTLRRRRMPHSSHTQPPPLPTIMAEEPALIVESATTRRTPLEIYTSGAIPYDRSTLAIAYDVSHLTALSWRQRRSAPPPPLVPSVVPSLVKAYHAAKQEVMKAPASKSSRSFKNSAADVISGTVGHPLLHVLAGTTHQVPGLASGSGGATPRGNPFTPSYPIWSKTGLPVNEAHERDRKEKEVYPVKPLARSTAPMAATMALNLTPSPAIFPPHRPELLRTLITEMAGHPRVDHSSRSGWLRPSALHAFTTLQPPDAIKVDAATAAADKEGELRVGMPYLYGDAVRAPGQLGSMDAKVRAARAKDRKLKASQKVEGSRKLKLSFSGGAAAAATNSNAAKSEAEILAEVEAEEALLRDRDEIMLRATWPTMDESRGDWQELMEPVTMTEDHQPPPAKIIAFGTGKRLSDIHLSSRASSPVPASAQAQAPAVYDIGAGSAEMVRTGSGSDQRPPTIATDRKLVFRLKRPGDITPISESPPLHLPPLSEEDLGGRADDTIDVDAEQVRNVSIPTATTNVEGRPGLKFKLKMPAASDR